MDSPPIAGLVTSTARLPPSELTSLGLHLESKCEWARVGLLHALTRRKGKTWPQEQACDTTTSEPSPSYPAPTVKKPELERGCPGQGRTDSGTTQALSESAILFPSPQGSETSQGQRGRWPPPAARGCLPWSSQPPPRTPGAGAETSSRKKSWLYRSGADDHSGHGLRETENPDQQATTEASRDRREGAWLRPGEGRGRREGAGHAQLR
jgi:hypothetical protein